MRRAAALALTVAAAGCTLDYGGLGQGGGGASAEESASTSATSSTTTGTGGGAACASTLGALREAFDAADAAAWPGFNGSVTIAGGALTLTMPPAPAGGIFRQAEVRAGDAVPRGLPEGCAVEVPMPILRGAWGGVGLARAASDTAWILWADGAVVELWARDAESGLRFASVEVAAPERLRLRHDGGSICAEADAGGSTVPITCQAAGGWEAADAVLLLTLEETESGAGGEAVFAGVGPGT